MWKKKEISVSSASAISLKAELIKSAADFNDKKSSSKVPMVITSGSKIVKPEKKAVKSKDTPPTQDSHTSLEASYVALQRKAVEYSHKLESVDDNEEQLVDFLKKDVSPKDQQNKSPEDPWVEVKDDFGRTRLVRKSTLKSGPSLVSNDMKMQQEREEWEKEAREEMKSLHFSSTKEIRTLGTGFYQFSQDEQERSKQMSKLKRIRDETILSRDSVNSIKEAKKAALDKRKQLILEKKSKKTTSDDTIDSLFKSLSK